MTLTLAISIAVVIIGSYKMIEAFVELLTKLAIMWWYR